MIETITDQTFDEAVLNSEIPVVVDFWAPWCNPCKALAPVLDELAQRHAGNVKVVKVNIDDEAVKAQQYAIRAVPTLLFFANGKLLRSATGVQSLTRLEQLLAA